MYIKVHCKFQMIKMLNKTFKMYLHVFLTVQNYNSCFYHGNLTAVLQLYEGSSQYRNTKLVSNHHTNNVTLL